MAPNTLTASAGKNLGSGVPGQRRRANLFPAAIAWVSRDSPEVSEAASPHLGS